MNQRKPLQAESLLMRDLENAAMHFEKRNYFLQRALHKYIAFNHLRGISFIRFSPLFKQGYNLIYVGLESSAFQQWIRPLISDTLEETMLNIAHTAHNPNTILHDKTISSYEHGIIISWVEEHQQQSERLEQILCEGLKAISYVELKEYDYFYKIGTPFESDVARSIQEKDEDGLVELLSLTKLMTKSDITFWGEADSRQVEVDMHIGSKNNDFGFLLPVGEGIGGLAAKNKMVLQVSDYQNCPYRYKDVSVAVDEEKIRSVFALPLKDSEENTSGILYVGNRTINPLPLEKKFLLLRLGNQLEPIVKRKDINLFFTPLEKETFFKRKKSELRKIGQNAQSFTEVETWLAKLLKGHVQLVDPDGNPYNSTTDQIKQTNSKPFYAYAVTHHERNLGKLYIWTDIKLPLQTDWPDLIDDVIYTICIINERNERYYHLAELERSQWLYNMLQSSTSVDTHYDKGVQLHIPVDQGEVWAFRANKTTDIFSLDEKMALEAVTLDCLRQPVYFYGTSAFIIFNRTSDCSPEHLRNQLLAVLPVETWLVHGATYQSFSELQTVITQLQTLLETAVREKTSDYIFTFEHYGLDNLLSNPSVSDELLSFAKQMLQPVIQYDKKNESELTKTLALSLVYKSPTKVAKKLYIHPNTVHYRVNRAKQLLHINLEDVRQEIALTFAAYTWLFKHHVTINE